jgi:hypothetical protein
MPLIILAIIVYFVYTNFFGDESGCDRYASSYSCDYVEEEAKYEVWYWFNVAEGNASDERYIGAATGLSNCRSVAHSYHRLNESFNEWNSRSYICILMKDGTRMEKHR